jgi:hypothetical protein
VVVVFNVASFLIGTAGRGPDRTGGGDDGGGSYALGGDGDREHGPVLGSAVGVASRPSRA